MDNLNANTGEYTSEKVVNNTVFDWRDVNTVENEICDVNSFNSINLKNNLIIMHINIRSLNKNMNNLNIYVKRLHHKPHVIVCTETWNIGYHNMFHLENYDTYYNHSSINKADGVIMFVDSSLNHTITLEHIDKLNILSCVVNINKANIIISGIYRCHNYDKPSFISHLNEYIVKNKTVKNHFIVGDFNIDLLDQDCDAHEHILNLLENEYLPLYHKVTRPNATNKNKGTCVDNVFAKSTYNYNSYKIMKFFTDHLPLIVTIDIIQNKTDKNNIHKKFIDFKKLHSLAAKQNWQIVLTHTEPDHACNVLIKMLKEIITKSTKMVTNKNRKFTPRKSWITTGIMNSCNTKESLYNLWRKYPDNSKLQLEYKKYDKILSKVIMDAKHKYEISTFRKVGKDSKNVWNYINSKLNRKKTNKGKVNSIEYNGNKYESLDDIGNIFNNFFADIGETLANNINVPRGENPELPKRHDNSFYLHYTNSSEIEKIIKSLKNKAGGVDGISVKVLKLVAGYILTPLEHIFNLCIFKAEWPSALKIAEIIPIHKSGNKLLPTNYRPISLISNIAKIFEKLIHKRLYSFIDKQKILSSKQFGFRKNMGTKEALITLVDKITDGLDNNKKVIATFLDLAKAFDTVNHPILLKKLARYGIRGLPLLLIKSYLTNRKQYVNIDGHYSGLTDLKMGVPQGTVLGPLLFILYINELLEQFPESPISSYADDTVIISTEDSWSEAEKQMNIYLDKVHRWLALNKLSLNVLKTVYIAFGSYNDSVPDSLNVHICNASINRVYYCKYLGLFMDSRLKWEHHIQYLVKKTKYLIYVFAKLAKSINADILLTIYYSLFHSIGTYGIVAWGGAYSSALINIQKTQNRLLKIASRKSNNLIFPLSLKETYLLEAIVIDYKILSKNYKNSLSKTRNKIILPEANKTLALKSHNFISAKIFCTFNHQMKIMDIDKFKLKKKVKEWMHDNTTKLMSINVLNVKELIST